jgi:hypothetical protein
VAARLVDEAEPRVDLRDALLERRGRGFARGDAADQLERARAFAGVGEVPGQRGGDVARGLAPREQRLGQRGRLAVARKRRVGLVGQLRERVAEAYRRARWKRAVPRLPSADTVGLIAIERSNIAAASPKSSLKR